MPELEQNALKITIGDEYRVKVEENDDFKKSFIYQSVYARAGRRVADIIEKNKLEKKNEPEQFEPDWDYNNIVAFVGDRGVGKSSAMFSFARAVTSKSKDLFSKAFGEEKITPALSISHFETLDVIDPSVFEDNDDIIGIVIAKMFTRFKKEIYKDNKLDFDKKRELLKKFQKVFENLKTLNQSKKDWFNNGQDIEVLDKLATGANLKKYIGELIKSYLDFITDQQNVSKFLIIMIDDFDLNIRYAAEMTEQIRKYLITPQVVILMALNFNQLRDIIQQDFSQKYLTSLKLKTALNEDPKDMAVRYLEKFIPEKRRIYLPTIYDMIITNPIYFEISDLKKQAVKQTNETISQTILRLIYEKTGMIFIEPENDIHLIMPTNLRGLISLANMLYNLENISEDEAKKETMRYNLNRFSKYFHESWCKENLTYEHNRIIEEIKSIEVAARNKFVIDRISSYMDKYITDKYGMDEHGIDYDDINWSEYLAVTNRGNSSVNISLGDVLFVLNKHLIYCNTSEFKKFIFAVKTIYSFMIYRYLFQDSLDDEDKSEGEKKNSNIQLILGGAIYNPEFINLIRIDGITGYSHFEFDYKNSESFTKTKKFLKDIKDDKLPLDGELKIEGKEKNELLDRLEKQPTFVNDFFWLPFHIIRYGEKKSNYRAETIKYYDRYLGFELENIEQYLTYDVFACISNLCYPERTIKRFLSINFTRFEALMKIPAIKDFVKKLKDWKIQYKCLLPLYSIELLETILSKCEFKGQNDSMFYIPQFYNNLLKVITEKGGVLDKNKFIPISKITNPLLTCPLLFNLQEDKLVKDGLQQISNRPPEIKNWPNEANISILSAICSKYKSPITKYIEHVISKIKNSNHDDEIKLYADLKEIINLLLIGSKKYIEIRTKIQVTSYAERLKKMEPLTKPSINKLLDFKKELFKKIGNLQNDLLNMPKFEEEI